MWCGRGESGDRQEEVWWEGGIDRRRCGVGGESGDRQEEVWCGRGGEWG